MNKPDVETAYKTIVESPIGKHLGDRGSRIFAEKACCTQNLKDGEFLFTAGDITTSFFIVQSGRFAVVKVKKNKDKPPRILHIHETGDMLGELSFIDDTSHSTCIMALGDATALQFKAEDIRPLILQEPQVMFDFMRAVVKRVHHGIKSMSKQQNALADYIATAGKGRT